MTAITKGRKGTKTGRVKRDEIHTWEGYKNTTGSYKLETMT